MEATAAARPSPSRRDSAPIRVAFLWPFGERSARELSGMPWAMERALADAGLEVIPVLGPKRRTVLPRAAVEVVCGHGVIRTQAKRLRQRARRWRDGVSPSSAMRRHLTQAKVGAAELSRLIHRTEADIIFGCCISSALGSLRTRLPIFYYSDTTARLITTTYPAYRRRSAAYKHACDMLERTALHRADMVCFATEAARRSAIEHYGVSPGRAFVAPMGATITPDDLDPSESEIERRPPARDDLRLCVVASDPERKRVDLCVEIAAALRERSWNATLTLIGDATARARSAPFVTHLGRLDHSKPEDRAIHAATLARTHLLLQPSIGEAYGIAPCEAAAFGAPSVVSDAGGLPEVVRHDETGAVAPVDASASAYADAVERVVADLDRYHALSRAALERFDETLNWRRWGETVGGLMKSRVDASPPEINIAAAIRRGIACPQRRSADRHGVAP